MRPREARSACLRADLESTLDELRRANVGALTLRRLLTAREATDWAGRSDVVEITDDDGRRTHMALRVPAQVRSHTLGVLVILHGSGGSGEQVLDHFAGLADRLSMAVVCPTAQRLARRSNNFDLAGIFGRRFDQPRWDPGGHDFPLAALRWARAELDVDPDRCALAGVSMGGIATWNLGMRSWHSFSAALPINGAPSMWETFGPDRQCRELLPNLLSLPMFVIHGSRDEQIPAEFDRDATRELRSLGHDSLKYLEIPNGKHGFETLQLRPGTASFQRLERWLSRRRRGIRPSLISHRCDDERHGRAHWVRINGIIPRGVAHVRAERHAADDVRMQVTGADQVMLYLSSASHRPGQIIRVRINGVTSRVRFEPNLETIVTTFRESGDAGMVAEQIITLEVPQSEVTSGADPRAGSGHAHAV